MSFTLIDFFNGFQSLKANRKFLASTQSTYFAILAKFNSAHYPATLPISTRDLKDDAGLKSVATAHECRNVLKNNKLIDFQAEKGTTVYRLLTEHLTNKNPLSAEHQPNAKRTAGGLFNSPAHGEVKTIDRDDDGRVREGDVATATKPQVSNTSALPLKSPIAETDANAIQDEWEKAFGYELRGDRAITLEEYAAKDYARTQAAMAKTARKLPLADPFAYFQKVYDACTPQQTRVSASPPSPPKKQEDDSAAEERRKLFGWE